MNDPDKKLALIQSVKWSFQWALAIILGHQAAVAAFAGAGVVLGLLSASVPAVAGLAFLVYSVAMIPLALLTHSEVLRGPSALDAWTLGRGPGRVLGYLLDTLLIGIVATLCGAVPVLLIGILASGGGAPIGVSGGLEVVIFVVFLVVILVVFSRPALRLPSRIFGSPISWVEAWQLGRGNTLPLVLGPILIALPLAVVERAAEWVLPAIVAQPVSMILVPLQVILTCAFLSVAYGQLRDATAAR